MGASRAFITFFSFLAVSSTSAVALLANETTYVATSNNEISLVDFGAQVASPVVTLSGQNFVDIALREDENRREVVAGSTTQQGAVYVFDIPSAAPKFTIPFSSVAGVAVSPNGDVYFTTGTSTAGDAEQVLVAARAGGALQPPLPVDPHAAGIAELTDVEYVATTSPPDETFGGGKRLFAGDILVLAKSPARLLRYCGGDIEALLGREVHGCRDAEGDRTDVVVPTSGFGGAEPIGVTFAPDGTLLVSTRDGRVLHFGLDGQSLGTLALLPGNGGRIDAAPGADGASGRVVVALQSGGVASVHYPSGDVGPVVTSGVSSTGGVAIQSGNAAFTPAVPGTLVSLQSFTAEFENPTRAGATASNCITFADPRETAGTVADPALVLPELSLDPSANGSLPPDVVAFLEDLDFEVGYPVVPGFIRGFPRIPGGEPVLRLCEVSTSAQFRGLIDVDSNEFPWLGYKPSCSDPASYQRPRFFYAEDTSPQIHEGETFINITNVCNRDGASGWRWGSLFITGARELRPSVSAEAVADADCTSASSGVLNCQLKSLEAILDGFLATASGDRRTLRQLDGLSKTLTSVIRRFDRGQYCRAKSDLEGFEAQVNAAIHDGLLPDTEEDRLGPELRSRAEAALFTFALPEVCP